MGARSRPRPWSVRSPRVYMYACIRAYIRIHSSQVELGLGWVGCVETMDDFG